MSHDDELPALLLARLSSLVAAVHRADDLVRTGDPEGIHDLRVALRRTRSLVSGFGAELALDPADSTALHAELRRAGQELSELRDVEVVEERLFRALGAETEHPSAAARALVDDYVHDARQEATMRAEAMRRSPAWSELLAALDRLGQAGCEAAPDTARRRLRQDWRRLCKRARAADPAAGEDHEGATVLHDVRKAAKKARYTAETLAPLLGDKAVRMQRAAEQVQETLGDHRDTLLTRRVLRLLGDQPRIGGDVGFLLGRLHAEEEQAGVDALRRAADALEQVREKRLRRWLG